MNLRDHVVRFLRWYQTSPGVRRADEISAMILVTLFLLSIAGLGIIGLLGVFT